MQTSKFFRCWPYALALVLAFGAATSVYALRENAKPISAPPVPTPASVTVAQPVRKSIDVENEWVGQVDSPQTVELRARVEGFIKEISFADGAEIEKGALLFVIDPAPYEVALRKTQAQLQTSTAAMTQAKDTKQIEVNKANVERSKAALANATQVVKDYYVMLASNAVARDQVDKAVTTEKQAAATVAADEAALAQAESDYLHNIAKAEAGVAVDRAAVADAELNLGYTRIFAPTTGRIGRAEVKIGSLVGKGEPTLLATVSQMNPVWVYFSVSEREAFELHKLGAEKKLGRGSSDTMPLKMTLEDGTVYPFKGTLNYTARSLDAGTGTLTMRAEFPNPDRFLRPGNYAKVRAVITERPNALLVSERAIGADQTGKYLLLVNSENKVERRAVEAGVRSEGMIVIEKGLKGDEQVVVNGLQRAQPGATVTPVHDAVAGRPAPLIEVPSLRVAVSAK